jgi:sulfate transport system ATP-binding protein
MGFVGPVNRLGESFVRPHDVDLRLEPSDGSVEAMIHRLAHLGFEVRIDLALSDGRPLRVQVTRDRVEELELAEGQIVHLRPNRATTFENGERISG